MFRKTVSAIMLLLLLVSMLTLAVNIQPAQSDYVWSETIYIRADGSIEPAGAPIFTVDSVTYTFTDNIVGDVPEDTSAIVIERDNIVLNGAGCTLRGNRSSQSSGIGLNGRTNVTVLNVNIENFYNGVFLGISSNNSISGNNFTSNNYVGINLWESSNNNISGNNITNNFCGIWLQSSSNNNSVSGNIVAANQYYSITLESSPRKNSIIGNNITDNGRGIELISSWGNSVRGNNITSNSYAGINLKFSENNNVSGNNIVDNDLGIFLDIDSSNNSINGNTFFNDGLAVSNSYGNVVVDNVVNGKPLVYLEDVSDHSVENAGQVILINCSRMRIENLNLSHVYVGVQLWKTNNTIIGVNNLTNNAYGISISYSSDNSVSGNNIRSNNQYGISLSHFSNSSISGNNITNNACGIFLTFSSIDNSLSMNNVASNIVGIAFYSASNNSICQNNFINNTVQVLKTSVSNFWDNGLEGNYWSDYEETYPNATEIDDSGIWNTPYVIDENNQDNYPLMSIWWNLCDINKDGKVNIQDLFIVAKAFGSHGPDIPNQGDPASEKWNAIADVNKDNLVNIQDLFRVAKDFGKTL